MTIIFRILNKAEQYIHIEGDEPDVAIVDVSFDPSPHKSHDREMRVKVRSRSGIQRFPMFQASSLTIPCLIQEF